MPARLPLLLVATSSALAVGAGLEPAQLMRLHPLGGKAGTAVEVEILGTHLETASGLEFDCQDLVWKHTTLRESGRVRGIVWIEPGAALGGHMLHVMTSSRGPSTSLLFNVGQFPAILEGEHRSIPALPAEVYGRLEGAADIDTYWFAAKAGERWLFDLRAMEHGSAVEARMMLLDGAGKRIAFNDDRDHYDENPLIEHVFAQDGVYAVKLDQYRGPRGFTFGKNNGYTLRISSLPRVRWVSPLGARLGATTRLTVIGAPLNGVGEIYLTQLRRGEYARMTYPYTMPIRFGPDPARASGVARIAGKIVSRGDDRLEAEFAIRPDAAPGLWRLWLSGSAGVAEGPSIEIGGDTEVTEQAAMKLPVEATTYAINGLLGQARERDTYRIHGKAGVPLHVWTLSAQLGGTFLDTVLTLRDESGKTLAECDDVVAGWGGLLGNPDSSVFYVPEKDGPLLLEVRDRLNRGGPEYVYRLKVDSRRPGFQLFTTPENVSARKGGTAEVKVHLVREAGFAGEVEIQVDALPGGTEPLRAKFRSDQVFEPNADGADMIIPEISFAIKAPSEPGVFPLRIVGKAANGLQAEAQTATMIGPIYSGDWNFYRRPVPRVTLTVID